MHCCLACCGYVGGLTSRPLHNVQGAPTAAAQGSGGGGAQQGGSIAASLSRGVFSRVGSLLGSGSGGGSKKVHCCTLVDVLRHESSGSCMQWHFESGKCSTSEVAAGNWSLTALRCTATLLSWLALDALLGHRCAARFMMHVDAAALRHPSVCPTQEARLGEDNAFYYDEATGRWQERGKAPAAEPPPPPPPPKAAPLPPPPAGEFAVLNRKASLHAATCR